MIGNRALSVTLVKQPQPGKNDNASSQPSVSSLDNAGQVAAIVQCTVETVGKTFVAGYLAKKLIDTTCEIAMIVAKSRL